MTYAKATWARSRANKLRQEASALPIAPAGDWRAVRRRMDRIKALEAEAQRFDRIAWHLELKAG